MCVCVCVCVCVGGRYMNTTHRRDEKRKHNFNIKPEGKRALRRPKRRGYY
jgi:hypothetical protein